MSEANKAVVRRWIDEAWNEGKVEVLDEILAQDYVHRVPNLPELRGPEGLKKHHAEFRAEFAHPAWPISRI